MVRRFPATPSNPSTVQLLQNQLATFAATLKLNQTVSVAIGIETSTLENFKRLSSRGKTDSKRPYDESMELIINRLDEFYTRTQIVGEYYKKHKKFTTIDGHGSEDEIFDRLVQKIDHTLTAGR